MTQTSSTLIYITSITFSEIKSVNKICKKNKLETIGVVSFTEQLNNLLKKK